MRRAFLQYWFDLQHRAFADAVTLFSPKLVASIGSDRIVDALQAEATYYASTSPAVTGVQRHGATTTVLYTARSPGTSMPLSLTWTQMDGGWRIYYDPLLNSALQQAAQNKISPVGKPSPQALRAGARAAQLQPEYLRRVSGK